MARFKVAGPISTAILDLMKADAIVSPTRTIYIRKQYLHDETLRNHEKAHLAQWNRDGFLRFWFFICLWYIYPGYDRSPYEIEARAAAINPDHPLWASA